LQLATGCNQKKTLLGCRVIVIIEKNLFSLQLVKETRFGLLKLNVGKLKKNNQLEIVKNKLNSF